MLLDDYKNVNKMLTEEEIQEELIAQEDFDAIVEWIQESGYLDIADNYSVYNEATIRTKNITGTEVMSKNQYEKLVASKAAIAAAKKANDANYHKLVKVSRLRKKLLAQLNQKYATTARKSAKAAIKAAKKTSNTVVKAPSEGTSGLKKTPNKAKVAGEGSKK